MTINQKLLLISGTSAVLILFGGAMGYLSAGEYLNGIMNKGTIMIMLMIGTVFGAALSMGTGFIISRSISSAIRGTIDGLSDSTVQVTAASSQVASASQSLAEGSSVAASAIEETSSSLEEMSSMTRKTLENSSLMTKTGDITFTAMKNSHKSLRETDACMKRIGESGAQAAKIIKTSDEIAFQINLLALNAAVEAARAGEAGAGFAVVAEEVRNLAMRSAEAARNTESIIGEMSREIKEGMSLVAKTLEEFYKMGEEGKKTNMLIKEIDSAMQEQAQGIEQINRAIGEMDKITQKAAANAEETASAAEELSAQSAQMESLVADIFTITGMSGNDSGLAPSFRTVVDSPGRHINAGNHPAGRGIRKRLASLAGNESAYGESGRARTTIVRPDQIIPLEEDNAKSF